MSKIFKRITAVFLSFLIMFWAVPNITEWAPMNDVSMIVEANYSEPPYDTAVDTIKPTVPEFLAQSPSVELSGDTLTLKGNVVKEDVQAYARKSAVKKVVAEKGTVLPADCSDMFQNFTAVSIDLSQADSSNVVDMSNMFKYCSKMQSLDISSFDTSNVTNMSGMFYLSFDVTDSCLQSLDVSNFDTSKVTDMSYMFAYCDNLESLDLSNFDTSKVTDMHYMFAYCSKLQSLDVSSFDTSNVTDMSYMFCGYNNLQSLDVSNFDTSNVTDMSDMFYDCNDLQSLDVSNFNTSKVTDMSYMFYHCNNLQSLDVSNFDTSKVTGMYVMFAGCSNLQSLDLSSFDTSKVTRVGGMFGNCGNLKTIIVSNKWNVSKVDPSVSMFFNCISLVGGNGTVYDYSYMYASYARIDAPDTRGYLTLKQSGESLADKTAVLSGDVLTIKGNVVKEEVQAYANNSNVKRVVASTNAILPDDCSDMFKNFKAVSIDLSSADSSNVTKTNAMFYGCRDVEKIYLGDFSASKVVSMSYMFSYCTNLKSLNLSDFNTSRIAKMNSIFYNCTNLTKLDLRNLDTSNVTEMDSMFYNCQNLKTIMVDNKWNTSKVNNSNNMFTGCTSLVGGNDTVYSASHTDAEYARIDTSDTPGYLKFKQYEGNVILSGDTLILSGNISRSDVEKFGGNIESDSSYYGEYEGDELYTSYPNIKTIIAEEGTVLPKDCRELFYCFISVSTIDLSRVDTSKVRKMSKMFFHCTSLEKVVVSDNWDISIVQLEDTKDMFFNCNNIQGSNGTKNKYKYEYVSGHYCSGCDIDYTPWIPGYWKWTPNDKNIYDKENARIDKEGEPGYLTDVGTFIGTLTDSKCLDYDLTTGTLFLKGNVIKEDVQAYAGKIYVNKVVAKKGAVLPADCSNMFKNFKALSIDLSQADTSKVTDMSYMFYHCNKLVTIDLSNFNTSKVISMSYMFEGCGYLRELDLSSFNTSKITKMEYIFKGCYNLSKLDLSNFDTSKVTDMNNMFAYCRSLKTLDLSNFNTSNVINMSSMFYYCDALQSVELSSFDTSNVTNMSSMFYYCENLKTIIVGDKWNTSNVNSSNNMFFYCRSLVGGNGTKYMYYNPEDAEYARIDTPDTPGYLTYKNVSFNGIGDFDGDGIVDGFDMLLARKALIKQFAGSGNAIDLAIADVNGDNSFTIADIVTLGNYLKCRVKKLS